MLQSLRCGAVDDPFPDLAAAASVEVPPLPYAPWARRIAGALVDIVVMSAIAAPFTLGRVAHVVDGTSTPSDVRFVTVVSLVTQVAYMTAFHGWRGATIGKMVMRTVLRKADGTPVSFDIAFVRAVTLAAINFVSNFVLLVPSIANALRPLWHPARQTWHDQVARTVVLSVRAGPAAAPSPSEASP